MSTFNEGDSSYENLTGGVGGKTYMCMTGDGGICACYEGDDCGCCETETCPGQTDSSSLDDDGNDGCPCNCNCPWEEYSEFCLGDFHF